MIIRWMIDDDFEKVADIDFDCFEKFWSKDDWAKVLRKRNFVGMVGEHRSEIIGAVLYSLDHDSLTLHRIMVAPHYRRNGVGLSMVNKLTFKKQHFLVHVPESDVSVQRFFAECLGDQIKSTRTEEDYYANGMHSIRFHAKTFDDSVPPGVGAW